MAMAKTYLQGKSPEFLTRTWAFVIQEIAHNYCGPTLERWLRVTRSKPFDVIRNLPLVDTDSSHFIQVLRHPRAGTSTNLWLRRLHNFTMDMGWLLMPVLPKAGWPKIKHKTRYAITAAEHQMIIDSEQNQERKLFYELLWETGGSQSDIACLSWANVDSEQGIIFYHRKKLESRGGEAARIRIGSHLTAILEQLPQAGLFFPRIAREESKHRSAEFKRRCCILGIKGRSLHSYRYAWAERAYSAGMPEREAMAHLGHKSSAIHRAYARKADNVTMPLEFYEDQKSKKVIDFSILARNKAA
ncbi:MAG: tyrosine-type recombinase/integrase [Methylacidiphilales bacterium]|nr:tyrosine-type recombinase/integrase [Candidatus Methylacidiphilales bacterium]